MALALSVAMHHPVHDYRDYTPYSWQDSAAPAQSRSIPSPVYDPNDTVSDPTAVLFSSSSSTPPIQNTSYSGFMSPHAPTTPVYSSAPNQRSPSCLQYALRPAASLSPYTTLASPTGYDITGSSADGSPHRHAPTEPSFASAHRSSGPGVGPGPRMYSSRAPDAWTDTLFTIDEGASAFADSGDACGGNSVPRSPTIARSGSRQVHQFNADTISEASSSLDGYGGVKADPDECDLSARFILEHPSHTGGSGDGRSGGDTGLLATLDPISDFSRSALVQHVDDGAFPTSAPAPILAHHQLTAPLRAAHASKEMRALMGVFRLDPFTMLNGVPARAGGADAVSWDGFAAGPLEEEPVMLEFQLYYEGMVIEDTDEGSGAGAEIDIDASTSASACGSEENMIMYDGYRGDRVRRGVKYEAAASSSAPRSIFDRYLEQQRGFERRSGHGSASGASQHASSSSSATATFGSLRMPDRYDTYGSSSAGTSPISPYPPTPAPASTRSPLSGFPGAGYPASSPPLPTLQAPAPVPANMSSAPASASEPATLHQLRTQAAFRAISSHAQAHSYTQQPRQQSQPQSQPQQPQPQQQQQLHHEQQHYLQQQQHNQQQPQPPRQAHQQHPHQNHQSYQQHQHQSQSQQAQALYRSSTAGVTPSYTLPTPASLAAEMHVLAARGGSGRLRGGSSSASSASASAPASAGNGGAHIGRGNNGCSGSLDGGFAALAPATFGAPSSSAMEYADLNSAADAYAQHGHESGYAHPHQSQHHQHQHQSQSQSHSHHQHHQSRGSHDRALVPGSESELVPIGTSVGVAAQRRWTDAQAMQRVRG